MNLLKRATIAAFTAAALLSPLAASAVDITVKVANGQGIKPWFRSNCWNGSIVPKTTEWVDFGFIQAFTLFPWTEFETLMSLNCRKPFLEFSYTLLGEPASEAANPRRVIPIRATLVTDVVVITLGSGMTVQDVEINGIDQE